MGPACMEERPTTTPAGWRRYRCRRTAITVAAPPGWTVDESRLASGRVAFRAPDGEGDVAVNLLVMDVIHTEFGALRFGQVAASLVRSLQASVTGYREVRAVRGPRSLRLDYAGDAGRGTLLAVESAAAIGILYAFLPHAAAARHATTLETMLRELVVDG